MRAISIPVLLVASLVLTSCVSSFEHRQYPADWSQLGNENSGDICPVISGFYKEFGEIPCSHGQQHNDVKFRYLSYQLLSTITSARVESEEKLTCKSAISGNILELLQPEDNQLQIRMWELDGNTKTILHEQILDMKKGDFTCEDGFMNIRKRRLADSYIVANFFGSKIRSFSVSEDGWLIMNSYSSGLGHNMLEIGHYFMFGRKREITSWYRWEPVDKASINQSIEEKAN